MRKMPEPGDLVQFRVRIAGLSAHAKGRVLSRNGNYVLVRPLGKTYEVECYPSELNIVSIGWKGV